MKCATAVLALILLLGAGPPDSAAPQLRFSTIDIVVDSGDVPLAAWQVYLHATRGTARIVGIEGGEHRAFADPPLYDERAMLRDEVRLAAYSTNEANALPRGVSRVVTVHVQVSDDVEWQVELEAAATQGARSIDARVELK